MDLREDVQTNLNTRHALDHANRHEPDNSNDHGDEEAPPVHVGRVAQTNTERNTKHDQEQRGIPPLRHVFILLHYSVMNIFFVSPDIANSPP